MSFTEAWGGTKVAVTGVTPSTFTVTTPLPATRELLQLSARDWVLTVTLSPPSPLSPVQADVGVYVDTPQAAVLAPPNVMPGPVPSFTSTFFVAQSVLRVTTEAGDPVASGAVVHHRHLRYRMTVDAPVTGLSYTTLGLASVGLWARSALIGQRISPGSVPGVAGTVLEVNVTLPAGISLLVVPAAPALHSASPPFVLHADHMVTYACQQGPDCVAGRIVVDASAGSPSTAITAASLYPGSPLPTGASLQHAWAVDTTASEPIGDAFSATLAASSTDATLDLDLLPPGRYTLTLSFSSLQVPGGVTVAVDVDVFAVALPAVAGATWTAGRSESVAWQGRFAPASSVVVEVRRGATGTGASVFVDNVLASVGAVDVALPPALAAGEYQVRVQALEHAAYSGDSGTVTPTATATVTVVNPYDYVPGPWGNCSVSCGPGEQTRAVPCADTSTSPPVVVDATVCSSRGLTPPASTQACTMPACPTPSWFIGSWGACSPACGDGQRSRVVQCRDPDGITPLADAQVRMEECRVLGLWLTVCVCACVCISLAVRW